MCLLDRLFVRYTCFDYLLYLCDLFGFHDSVHSHRTKMKTRITLVSVPGCQSPYLKLTGVLCFIPSVHQLANSSSGIQTYLNAEYCVIKYFKQEAESYFNSSPCEIWLINLATHLYWEVQALKGARSRYFRQFQHWSNCHRINLNINIMAQNYRRTRTKHRNDKKERGWTELERMEVDCIWINLKNVGPPFFKFTVCQFIHLSNFH